MLSRVLASCPASTTSSASLLRWGSVESGTSVVVSNFVLIIIIQPIPFVLRLWCSHVHYACSVYEHRGYRDVVSALAEESIQEAVDEVKALPSYPSEGEV